MKKVVYKINSIKELEMLYDEWALTFTGANDSDIDDIITWLDNFDGISKNEFYIFNGKLLNETFNLTGDNKYKDNLSFVTIKNEYICNLEKFSFERFKYPKVCCWLTDIIDNNLRHENRFEEIRSRKN